MIEQGFPQPSEQEVMAHEGFLLFCVVDQPLLAGLSRQQESLFGLVQQGIGVVGVIRKYGHALGEFEIKRVPLFAG